VLFYSKNLKIAVPGLMKQRYLIYNTDYSKFLAFWLENTQNAALTIGDQSYC
jgi:hypothetical protein